MVEFLGVMLLVAIALLEANLGRQIAFEQKRRAPSFFFVDVQSDQREAFSRLVAAANGGTPPALTPIVRSRIAAIDGVPVTRELIEVAGRKQISMLLPVVALILPVAIVFAFYPGVVAIRTLAR